MDPAALLADVEARPASLTALAAAADEDLLTRCGPFLTRRFRRYRLLGMGASYLAAAHAAARMRSLGLDAAADRATSQYGYPMGEDTLTVAVSASGATAEVLAAVDRLDGHFPVLALTGEESSPLAARAGAVLPLCAGDGAGPARTFAHTTVLLHGLTVVWTGGLPRMVGRDVAVLAERAAEATADLLARREEWLPDAVRTLAAGGADLVAVLARAEQLAAARWSAQVLRTTVRRPADGVESADWLLTHAHLTSHLTSPGAGLDHRAMVLLGSRADRRVLDRLGDRGVPVVLVGDGAGAAAADLSGRTTATAVAFDGERDLDLARVVAPTVAELAAAAGPDGDPARIT